MPYRGIQPFRYVDHAVFLAREEETEELEDLVAIYRGVLLYGASGDGKSSLINAGLLLAAARRRLRPERVRVQPRLGEEIVIERIATTDDESAYLPSLLAGDGDDAARVVMSVQAFEDRVRRTCRSQRPLLIFDQFEEIITLFEQQQDALRVQQGIVEMLVRLLREPLPVKLLFVFREDYLSQVKHLLASVPELVDQALRLEPLSINALPTIIRGPFERHPGHYDRELDPKLTERVCDAFAQHFGSADVSLSEVETVALRLWQSDDPQTLLEKRGVQGILEDYLGESLDAFSPDLRAAALALLAQMVTAAGTRNVISAEDLIQRVREEDEEIAPALLDEALERIERESRLIRRERRRDIYLYEITSEFLVPWISARREHARLARADLRRERERIKERRRLRLIVSIAGGIVVVAIAFAVLAIWALGQRSDANGAKVRARTEAGRAKAQARLATSRQLAAQATSMASRELGRSLLLSLAALKVADTPEAQGSLLAALQSSPLAMKKLTTTLRSSGSPVYAVGTSPDGFLVLAAAADGKVWGWRGQRAVFVLESQSGGATTSIAMSPDGRTLATGGDDATIRIWDIRSRRVLARYRGHVNAVTGLAFSPDGRTLISGSLDNTVRYWDARTGRQVGAPLAFRGAVSQFAVSPDGQLMASADAQGAVRLLLNGTRRPAGSDRILRQAVRKLIFNSDGRTLTAVTNHGEAIVWRTRPFRREGRPLVVSDRSVSSVAASPDGHQLAIGAANGSVVLWSYRSRWQLGASSKLHRENVSDEVFTPDGASLVSGSTDGSVVVWKVALRAWRREACAVAGRNLTLAEWQQFVRNALPYTRLCPRVAVRTRP